MKLLADVIDHDTGVDLHQLPPLTTLLVWTRNSSYEIVVVEGSTIHVRGGTSFPQHTPAHLDGARIGGSLLRVGWIVVGFPMEIRAQGQRILTSPVLAITTEPPGITSIH